MRFSMQLSYLRQFVALWLYSKVAIAELSPIVSFVALVSNRSPSITSNSSFGSF
jgi:hypothetical protein